MSAGWDWRRHVVYEPSALTVQYPAHALRARMGEPAKTLNVDADPCGRCPHQFRHHAVTEDGFRCRGCKCKRRFWR